MTIIEAIATVFGVICVWLTIKRNIWCWPAGLVQVTLFIYIFYVAKLYSDMGLHVIYVFMQFYGWYHWLYGGEDQGTLKVSLLGNKVWIWTLAGIAGTLLLGFLMQTYTDAAVPYPDAFTTVLSLIAQWLLARKNLESWIFWIIIDVAAIGIYYYKELYFTTALYAVFLVLATIGFFAWKKALKQIKNPEPVV